MGRRFAIVIGVAAAGVTALGAQTALAAAPDVVKYDTKLTITHDRSFLFHGSVESDREECMDGRRVILFKQRRGADRKVDTLRSQFSPDHGHGHWGMDPHRHLHRVYANVTPKVGDGFMCRADRSPTIKPNSHPRSLGAQTATSSTGEPVDSTPPDLRLSGPKKVSLNIHPEIPGQCCRPWLLVKASCGKVNGPPASPLESVPPEPWAANLPDTACTLSAEGKVMGDELLSAEGKVRGDELKPVEGALLGPPQVWCVPDPTICHWQSGGTDYLELKLSKKTRKQARKALDDGEKVRAKVTVEATDTAGNMATAKRTIRLVK